MTGSITARVPAPPTAGLREALDRMTSGTASSPQMAAAVLTAPGAPRFGSFDAPTATAGTAVVDVTAAGMNPIDLLIAAGPFPGMSPPFPSVAGHEGVGILDGRRVYFNGPVAPHGSMAQQTLVAVDRIADVPDQVPDGLAVALGTSGMAAWLSLHWRARLQPGETVLVLGATGVLGALAVQAARILGAGRIIAAGRDAPTLRRSAADGADAVVDLAANQDLVSAFRHAAPGGIDVVIDPLWGDPALAALQACGPFARHVQIGNAASPTSPVTAGAIRRASASILGYTNLMVPAAQRAIAYRTMAAHAAAGRLRVDVEHFALHDISATWARQAGFPHRKLVLVP